MYSYYNHINKKINDNNDKLLKKIENINNQISNIKYDIDYELNNIYKKIENNNTTEIYNDLHNDLHIVKNIYNKSLEEIKTDMNSILYKIDIIKTDNIIRNMATEFYVENIVNKNNNQFLNLTITDLDTVIKHNNNGIGINHNVFVEISEKNYEIYTIYHIVCNNIINYKLHVDEDLIIVNISYNINLIFANNEIISEIYTLKPVILEKDIDNEALLFGLKSNKIPNNTEINKIIKNDLANISLDPFINNYLVPVLVKK
jgi:hypothetical protein